MSTFTKRETDEILAVKNDIRVYVDQTKILHEWAENIFVSPENFYITGGAIASLLLAESPKDFDVYCRNQTVGEAAHGLLISQYQHSIKDVDEKYREVDCWKIPGKMATEKSVTMSNNMSFIVMNYGPPDQIKASFDFLHCTPHYDIGEDKLYISRAQYDSIKSKTLLVNNSDRVTFWRMEKFVKRGWNVSQDVKSLALRVSSKSPKPVTVNS
jgi:hypothetical protein